jgi:magnesium-transporting ATPase (P-type)
MIFPRRLSVPPSEPNKTDTAPEAPVELQESPAPPGEVVPVARPLTAEERGYEHVYEDDDEFDFDDRPARPRRLTWYVRIMLAAMAVGFTVLVVVALCLNPYTDDGTARTMETHRQLGLPRCNMVELTGKPCPACGMTTSFALLTHGDIPNSLKANWVGTLLCATIIVFTPWLVACSVRGRLLWVRNGELFATIVLSTLLMLMMGRWTWIMFFS